MHGRHGAINIGRVRLEFEHNQHRAFDHARGPAFASRRITVLGACPFNRFGRTCGEYDSAKCPLLSLGFYVNPPDWHAGEFHSPRLDDLRLLGQAPR